MQYFDIKILQQWAVPSINFTAVYILYGVRTQTSASILRDPKGSISGRQGEVCGVGLLYLLLYTAWCNVYYIQNLNTFIILTGAVY
jgi:hypothetical protein